MRTRTITGRTGPIATTLAILLAASLVGLVPQLLQSLSLAAGAPTGVLDRLFGQGPGLLGWSDAQDLLLRGLGLLLAPLAVIGLLLAIELWAGPAERSRKNRWLAWAIHVVVLVAAWSFAILLIRTGALPSEPLLSADATTPLVGTFAGKLMVFVLAVLVFDLFQYWVHRLNHAVPWLWRFHAVHHSPRDLDVQHSYSHPVERLVNMLLMTVPTAWLVGYENGQLFLIGGFFAVQAQLTHMNVPLHYGPFASVIADNRFHFVHHSLDPRDHNSNFAEIFPFLDRIFGTYCAPCGERLPETGLPDRDTPATIVDYLLARPSVPPMSPLATIRPQPSEVWR